MKRQGVHVAFLFASPMMLKDRTSLNSLKTVMFSKNIDMAELRKAWVRYYEKEYQYEKNIAEIRAEIKMKELEVTTNELSDQTEIFGQTWSSLKKAAMEVNFEPP